MQPATFSPVIRFDTFDALRSCSKQSKAVADALLKTHPAYKLIKMIREANYLAAILPDKMDALEGVTITPPKTLYPRLSRITEIAKSPLRFLGGDKNTPGEPLTFEEMSHQYVEACATRRELTPQLRVYEMERCLIEFLGGSQAYDKLPRVKLDFDLMRDPLPIDQLTHPVMICEDKDGDSCISLKITIHIDSQPENIYYMFHKTNRWVIRYCLGKREHLYDLGRALAFLFEYQTYSMNKTVFLFCLPFMKKILKGKPIYHQELLNSKISRTSDLRSHSLVAKKEMYS